MLRSAPLMIAAEATKARVDVGLPGSRAIVSAVLARPDEPGEAIAYWHSNFGRRLPKPFKRGVADAAAKMYNERAYLKWDSDIRAVRFADVIRLTHANPRTEWRSALFRYAIGERMGMEGLEVPEQLAMINARKQLRARTPQEIHAYAAAGQLADMLATAGMTWEAVPALVNGPWTAALWEAVIPSMGYMALLRNLRNFDAAGISDEVADAVAARLADPEQVARSRQFPLRFLSAYRAARSLRWGHPLSQALEASVSNIPQLSGRTLILVDTSGSMHASYSKDGTVCRWDVATLFALALARRCESAEVWAFSDRAIRFDLLRGESVLRSFERWGASGYNIGGGTYTAAATKRAYRGHDRVVTLTDEQSWGGDPGAVVPDTIPMYTWNLAGYRFAGGRGGPHRHTFGGLSDRGFETIPLIESGGVAGWPWEKTAA
ncbi:TROVE domain-containing protein [Nocardia sp. NPDC057030]|uniref:TROVE domain-containing protein n=1 Tax=unclassified Nocardia TaxID=2637762 RepID=UPI0036254FF7